MKGKYIDQLIGLAKKSHKGIVYYDKLWGKKGIYCRLIYLEDKERRFIPKERIKTKNLQQEKDYFFRIAKRINIDLKKIYFISSHYWDGGLLGLIINKEFLKRYSYSLPHIWTPHSLGILKKRKFKKASKSVIRSLNFPSRIKNEEKIISNVVAVVSTSGKVSQILSECTPRIKNYLWFPPGVDTSIFKPRTNNECHIALKILKERSGLNKDNLINLLNSKIIFFEASRTDRLKRKKLLLESFSKIVNKNFALLIMLVNEESDYYVEILDAFRKLKKEDNIILINNFLLKQEIAQIYSLANVYVTPSLSETWGMTVQEAAASKCAIVTSKNVPFATEILKEDALIVNKNYSRLFAEKIDIMIQEPTLRKRLANKCYRKVRDNYSWQNLTRKLISKMKKKRIIK